MKTPVSLILKCNFRIYFLNNLLFFAMYCIFMGAGFERIKDLTIESKKKFATKFLQ